MFLPPLMSFMQSFVALVIPAPDAAGGATSRASVQVTMATASTHLSGEHNSVCGSVPISRLPMWPFIASCPSFRAQRQWLPADQASNISAGRRAMSHADLLADDTGDARGSAGDRCTGTGFALFTRCSRPPITMGCCRYVAPHPDHHQATSPSARHRAKRDRRDLARSEFSRNRVPTTPCQTPTTLSAHGTATAPSASTPSVRNKAASRDNWR